MKKPAFFHQHKGITLSKRSGLIITLVLATIILFVFFFPQLTSLNNVYFAGDGDGLQAYYGTLYHVQHDTTYYRTQSMNYPYGEMVYFTGNQPLVANSIKRVSENIVDISPFTLGILNFIMLSSIVIGAIFIYLILKRIGLPTLYSTLVSVLIIYLSPQQSRLGGHFSLTYLFFIPMMLYLYMLYYEKPKWCLTGIISFSVFVAACTHFYIVAFIGLIWLFFWLVALWSEKEKFRKFKYYALHLSIQFIIPLVINQLILGFNDSVTDRTTHPWGILYLRAYPESVFLPIHEPYGKFLHKIMTFRDINIDWEGVSYIGLVSTIGFIFFLKHLFINLYKKRFKNILQVTESKILNIFFWTSIAGLLYSFGLPYILGLEFLLEYVGPLRQMRGIGRFAWLFFYIINIVTFYWLWKWFENTKYEKFKYAVLILAFAWQSYDMYLNCRGLHNQLNNKIPALTDRQNELLQNKWVKKIDAAQYQCIFPIPYFHVGSEYLWIHRDCGMKETFIASLKSGLPTNGVLLSRVSVNQTYKNLALFLEPYRPFKVLEDMPNNKPFLIVKGHCGAANKHEKRLVDMASPVDSNALFSVYHLPYDSVAGLTDSLYERTRYEMENSVLFKHEKLFTTDSLKTFYYNDFYGNLCNFAYMGVDAYQGRTDDWNVIFDDTIPNYDTTRTYIFSFWLGKIKKDLIPRSNLVLTKIDSTGKAYSDKYHNIGKFVTIIDDDWALIEGNIALRNPNDRFKISVINKQLRDEKLYIDELLIRPESNNIFRKLPEYLGKNNRYYKIEIKE